MDSHPVDRRLRDRGVSSIQFVFAAALSLILFLALANLVVVQYGRGALRSALEQGARAGSVLGAEECERTALGVVGGLLGGRMSDDLEVTCVASGQEMVAGARATFPSWTPLTPDFEVSISVGSLIEP